GGVLILFGVLFLLQAQGLINNVFSLFWPIILILVGGWMVVNVFWKPTFSAGETFSVPLDEAKSVQFKFAHGAAQIEIAGGAPTEMAIVGASAAGMNYRSNLDGDRLNVKVEAGPSLLPFVGPNDGVWRYQLTQAVPVILKIEAGASKLDINLQDVLASHIELKTGASSVNMTLPAHGVSLLDVEAGAASINLRVPNATVARIRVKEGVSMVNVDTSRFPKLDSNIYQSTNFDTAQDRAEIIVEAGLGSITVK
ncbi:MAG: hypothetical protein ABI986_12420, partial [Chloroflexota bacterium]